WGPPVWKRLEETTPGAAAVLFLAGAAAGIAALLRLARGNGLNRLAACFLGTALLGLAMAMRSPFYWPFWRFLPAFEQFTAIARALCLVDWGIAGLAALGIHALLEEGELRQAAARGALAGAGSLLLALGAAVALAWLARAAPGAPAGFPAHLAQVGPEAATAVVWLAAGASLAWLAGRQILPSHLVGLLAAGLAA